VIKQRGKADSEIIFATAPDVFDNGFTMEVVDSATAIEDPAQRKNLPSRTACYAGLRLRGSAEWFRHQYLENRIYDAGSRTRLRDSRPVLLGFYLWGIKQANKMIATKNREDAEAHLLSVEDSNPAVATDL
jgi:hypothetical protein